MIDLKALKTLSPEVIKKKQYLLLAGIVGASVVLVSIGTIIHALNDEDIKVNAEQPKVKRIEISKLANGTDSSHKLGDILENTQKGFVQKLEALETDNNELKAQLAELSEKVKKSEEHQGVSSVDVLAAELGRVTEELEIMRRSNDISGGMVGQNYSAEPLGQVQVRKIQNYELKLEGAKLTSYSLDNYIPPASFAPAVVISGVDASVGIQAQGEPRPMLFRITGKARSAAADGKVQKADIVGCTVTGAASGDLSSERVFIRLLKMTCSREDDRVFETELHGYVAGLGKAGIRGDVVSREGDFVFKSFLAGVASGAGNGLSQKFASPMALPSGLVTTQPTTTDVINSGLGGGITSSSNRLSDYLIKRAEQYQPVISVPAGIDVELVFNDGVYIDGEGGENEKVTVQQ